MIAQLDWLYIKTRPTKAVIRLISHLFFQGRFLTTKYRWLNRPILISLELIKKLPEFTRVVKPIFIIGIGRSGSTILGKVLSMHNQIGFLNESKATWYVIDPRDDINGHFHLGEAKYRFYDVDATPQKINYARRIFGYYSFLTGSERVLDKNPECLFRIPYIKQLFPDALFIFLVRNGWDTIHSITSWSKINQKVSNGHLEDWWGFNRRKWKLMIKQLAPEEPLLVNCLDEIKIFTREEDMAAVEWIISMQEGLRCLERWPDSILAVYYEDLVQDPVTELNRIISFCKLNSDDICLKYAKKTLISNKHKPKLHISPKILNAFESTMNALNY